MDRRLKYYADGSNILSTEVPVYINKAKEPVHSHLHAHDYIEIAYVMAGKGIHCIDDKEYSVSKGDLFIINYDIPHEFRSLPGNSESSLIVYNCIFRPEFIDYKLVNCKDFYQITQHFLFQSIFPREAAKDNTIKLLRKESKEIEDIYEKMYKEYILKENGYIEILRAYTIELLITIFRLHKKSRVIDESLDSQRRRIIDNIINYMRSNFSKELKLEELSGKAFLSPNYFSRFFKECTAMTVSEYLQKIRIEEACHLLRKTDKKVIEIAYEVGYRDIKYFNSIFKRINGKTPGEYRRISHL